MSDTHEDARRAALLMGKVEAWSLAEVLAYCQGLAYDRAARAACVGQGLGAGVVVANKVRRLRAGLRAMTEEIAACLAVLDTDGAALEVAAVRAAKQARKLKRVQT